MQKTSPSFTVSEDVSLNASRLPPDSYMSHCPHRDGTGDEQKKFHLHLQHASVNHHPQTANKATVHPHQSVMAAAPVLNFRNMAYRVAVVTRASRLFGQSRRV
jgi:hypothetical protein